MHSYAGEPKNKKIKSEAKGLVEENKSVYNRNDDEYQVEDNKDNTALVKARALLNKSMEKQDQVQHCNIKEEDDTNTERADSSIVKEETKTMQIKEVAASPLNAERASNLTIDYLKQSPHQIVDTKFLQHLAEMHPVSALHELTHRLGWPGPNITLAFDCGPPFAKMYIFKAQVNGQIFQNTVAVNDVKIAKQNVAWLALQEMGFVKPDPANPV